MKQQMTIGQMIDVLRRKDPSKDMSLDFVHLRPTAKIHSYRGIYHDAAIGWQNGGDCKISELLAALEKSLTETHYGYKGGEYRFDNDTPVWIANHNEAGQTAVVDIVDGVYITIITEKVDI